MSVFLFYITSWINDYLEAKCQVLGNKAFILFSLFDLFIFFIKPGNDPPTKGGLQQERKK